jgi:hypothetical protein
MDLVLVRMLKNNNDKRRKEMAIGKVVAGNMSCKVLELYLMDACLRNSTC